MKRLSFIVLSIVFCHACGQASGHSISAKAKQALAPAEAEAPAGADTSRTVSVAMAGDIMMGTTFPTRQLPANEGRDLFKDVSPILERADVAVGNLEGAMTDGGTSTKGNGPNSYAFRMPTSYAPLLKEAGFDFLSLANNHANDFGPEGIASTERCLEEQGILFSGIKGHEESAQWEKDGVRYGFCAFGHNSYTLRTQNDETVRRIVSELAGQCDIVIVSFHGGAEGAKYKHLPYGKETFLGEDRGDLRHFAHLCIDAGADVVFGQGPHVVRAVELYNDRFIAYSLGNFCTPFGMSLNGVNRYAPVIELRLNGEGAFRSGTIHPFTQSRGIGPRKDTTGEVVREIIALTKQDVPQSGLNISADGTMEKASR